MKRRIKWKNVFLVLIFIVSCVVLVRDYLIIVTSLAQFTLFGVVTNLLALTIASTVGEYLYDEMQ